MDSFAFANGSRFAVACSGGPDSMALVLLAQDWARQRGCHLVSITVDHALRPESAREAAQVAQWMKSHGIAHVILRREGKKPTRNIQEQARIARYRLMAEYCAIHSIASLLTAHTQDDQAETFLLRLARGSGVDGLSGMAQRQELYGLTLLRPLLGVSKAELVAFLAARKQPYIADPGNTNPRYGRVKMRGLLPQLSAVGLTPQRLCATAFSMRRARAFLEAETARFLSQHCSIHPEGYAVLCRLPENEEIALRVLAELLMCIGGHALRPRLEDMGRLLGALRLPSFSGATLAGCLFTPHRGNLLILREMKAAEPPVALNPGEETLWDSRFLVTVTAAPKGLRVGALTQAGWLEIARASKYCNPFPAKKILYTLPALYGARGILLGVPQLNLWVAKPLQATVVFRQRPLAGATQA